MSWLRRALSNAGGGVLPRFIPLLLVLILIAQACGSSRGENERPQGSEEVWNSFVAAFNDADLAALEGMIALDIEWSWDSDLFVIHRRASGSNEAMRGLEDLINRGITFETEIWEVEGDTVKAKTVFNEPGLSEHIGGHRLLQTDLVTVSDGFIQTWTTTANETIPSEDYLDS